MSIEFLTNFMRFVQATTRAERCLALDSDLNIHARVNVSDELLEEKDFSDLLYSAVNEANSSGDVVIANNLITDPEDAPQTNVHLHQLRMLVVIPLPGHGAVYFDQHIRFGVFPRELVEKLHEFAHHLVNNEKTDLTPADYEELFAS